jgi:hypothetical protein
LPIQPKYEFCTVSLIKWENNTWVNVDLSVLKQMQIVVLMQVRSQYTTAIRRDNLDINYDQTDYVYVEIFQNKQY